MEMLVGSGGVVALVAGAWSVLWAIRRVPGRDWRVWYPTVVAFLATFLGFAMLTAQSEFGIGLLKLARAEPDQQTEAIAEVLSYASKPLIAALISTAALSLAILACRGTGSGDRGRTPRWPEQMAMMAIGVFGAFDLAVWVSLRRAFVVAASSREIWLGSGPRIHWLTLLGALASYGLLGLAGLLALSRARRR